jgi:RNA polymerase sigma factor (sigma-70 family)
MTPEEFIKNNPFPENGREINDQLVRAIQDPAQADMRQKNLERLLENNARLVYMVYHQYNYNQDLGSIMSFVYEGIAKATETFDPDVGMPFYHYAVQTIRGLLQNWYNYHNDLIHIPVMKKKAIKKIDEDGNVVEVDPMKYDYTDINDFTEHQHCDDIVAVVQPEDDSITSELDQIVEEFKKHPNTTAKALDDLEMFTLYRKHTLKEISVRKKINTVKIRKMIDRSIERLKRFNRKLNNGTLYDTWDY